MKKRTIIRIIILIVLIAVLGVLIKLYCDEINSQNSETSTSDNRPEMGEQMGQPGGGDNSSSVTKTGATEFTSDVTEFSL